MTPSRVDFLREQVEQAERCYRRGYRSMEEQCRLKRRLQGLRCEYWLAVMDLGVTENELADSENENKIRGETVTAYGQIQLSGNTDDGRGAQILASGNAAQASNAASQSE